ncbi:MAG: hypothetical protein RIQ53_3869, partial [Pseudomonadota bacterium]
MPSALPLSCVSSAVVRPAVSSGGIFHGRAAGPGRPVRRGAAAWAGLLASAWLAVLAAPQV